jgi:translocation and assembly module TamB
MIARLFKIGRWSFLAIVVALLVLVLVCSALLFSQSGLNSGLWLVEKFVPQLTIDSAEGRLGRRFSLNNLHYKDDDLGIEFLAKKLDVQLNGYCFLQPALCIDTLQADGVSFIMKDGSAESAETDVHDDRDSREMVRSPLPIQIDHFEFTDASVDIYGDKAHWNLLSSGLNFRRDDLVIAPIIWRDVVVTLAENSAVESSSTASSNPPEPTVPTPQNNESPLTDVFIPLNITLSQFDLYNFRLEQDTPFDIKHLAFNAELSEDNVSINHIVFNTPDFIAWSTIHTQLSGDYPIDMTLSAKAKLDQIQGQKLKVVLAGSVKKLNVKATLSDLAEGELVAQLQPLDPEMRFSLALSKLKGTWPLVGQSSYQFEVPSLKGEGTLDQFSIKADAQLSGIDVPTLGVLVEGNGSVAGVDLSSITLKSLGGEVKGALQADWRSGLQVKSDLTLDNIQPQRQWPDVDGTLNGHVVSQFELTEKGEWAVSMPTLAISGLLRGYPLNANGELSLSGSDKSRDIRIATPGLTLSHGQNKISAKGELNKQWRMDLHINVPDLAKSLADASGTIMGNLALDGAFTAPKVKVNVTANKLAWQDDITLDSFTAIGEIRSPSKSKKSLPNVDLDLTATQFRYQDQVVNEITAAVSGTLNNHQVTVDVTSDLANTHLSVAGAVADLARPIWKGSVNQWSIASLNSYWALQDPIKIIADVDRGQATISAHCWRQKESTICIDKEAFASSKKAEVSFSIKQFDFSDFKSYLPHGSTLQGKGDASGSLVWIAGKAPKADIRVRLTDGQFVQKFVQSMTIGWNGATLNASLSNNRLMASLNIDIKDNGSIKVKADIPDVSIEDKGIQGTLTLDNINFSPLQPMVGEYSELAAILNSQLTFDGPIMHPRVIGKLTVSDAKLQGEISPVDILSGDIDVTFIGYQATLLAKIGTADGDLNVEGAANWNDMENWFVTSHLLADSLSVEVPPMVRIKASPDMKLELTPDVARVTGSIALPWGRITVDELPDAAVSVSDDQVLLDRNLKPIKEKDKVPFNLESNVTINIGRDFKLKAFGLRGDLTGILNVSQRENAPFVNGEVNILNGTYRSFGQDLVIQKGKIMMNGPVNRPYVSITAIRNPDNIEDDVTAGIKVSGAVDNPVVSVFSDPAMAQANALSYLLRGQDLDAESDNNAMTTSLIGLSLAQSGKFVGAIGEAFGVQDLQLDTNGAGDDSQVTVSGYVLPGLQVKYGVGIFNSLGEFTVRYRLIKDLYVEAVSGVTSAVDLLYQFEFD